MLAERDIQDIRSILAAYNKGRAAIHRSIQTRRDVALLVAPTIVFLAIAGSVAWFGEVSGSAIFLLSIVVAVGWAIHHEFLKTIGETAVQAVFVRLSPFMFGFVERLQPLETPLPSGVDRLPREFVGHFDKSYVTKLLSGSSGGRMFDIAHAHFRREPDEGSTKTIFEGVVMAFTLAEPFHGKVLCTRIDDPYAWERWWSPIKSAFHVSEIDWGPANYHYQTDRPSAVTESIARMMSAGMDLLLDRWRSIDPRVGFCGDLGFVLLPDRADTRVRLPDISVELDFNIHIEPRIENAAALVDVARTLGAVVRDEAPA